MRISDWSSDVCSSGLSSPGQAVRIRNATVHTATSSGTLQDADVLVRDGRIAAVGQGLSAAGARVVDAQGKPLTTALFGGISGIGIEEVSGEDRTTDNALALGAGDKDMVVRPEFDVTLAYNPDSVLVPVTRVEGIGFTLLGRAEEHTSELQSLMRISYAVFCLKNKKCNTKMN